MLQNYVKRHEIIIIHNIDIFCGELNRHGWWADRRKDRYIPRSWFKV